MNSREEALEAFNDLLDVYDNRFRMLDKDINTILQALTQPEPEVVSVDEVCDLKEFDNQDFLSVIKIINKHYPNKDILIRSSEK